ncbi:MAGE family-domain-containing protein [Absidia repens]|uniref:MAGE family-domain-containing protein n=1 Tax=Absidia repens TaxID=90262 RepID=A0A1X2HY74_9FUNG|nr:MAGE family-domain-containing protein [Absidia repens]
MIIRKEDINKKVLHEHSRQYNTIFKEAKEQLLDTFGMALLEIPAKDIRGRSKLSTTASGSSQQPAAQGRTPSSNSYILYNCLNKDLEAYKVIHQTDEEYASMGLLYFILSIILLNEQELQESYLQKFKETIDNQDTYQWGPRSKSEIPYKDLIKFMSSVSRCCFFFFWRGIGTDWPILP